MVVVTSGEEFGSWSLLVKLMGVANSSALIVKSRQRHDLTSFPCLRPERLVGSLDSHLLHEGSWLTGKTSASAAAMTSPMQCQTVSA